MIIDLSKELRRFGLRPERLLHVGAHEGREDELYRRINITPIYVEANPEVFERLRKNLPDRECHLVAISDREGTAELHITSMDQSSSLLTLKRHAEIYPDITQTKSITVRCTTIDQLMAGREEVIDVLSLDIQGAELMALQGATKLLGQLSCIMTEINRDELYTGCAQIDEIDDFLKQYNFVRVREAYPYHKSWGDAFYVKTELLPRARLSERLRRTLHSAWAGSRAA